jgi:hypothetical protein
MCKRSPCQILLGNAKWPCFANALNVSNLALHGKCSCVQQLVLMSLYPMPEPKRADYTPPVDCLGLGFRNFSLVKPAIERFLELGRRNPRRRGIALNKNEVALPSTLSGHTKEPNSDQNIVDLSFRRVSERMVRISEEVHDPEKCDRCRQGSQNDFYTRCLVMPKPVIVSTYGAILVESPDSLDSKTVRRHDLCLFLVEYAPLLEQKEALPLVVEDILQADMLCHTITHPPFAHSIFDDPDGWQAIIWNLPLPYRQPTKAQRIDIMNWCHELLDQPITKTDRRKGRKNIWTHVQMLLHFLRLGYSHIDASLVMKRFCDELPDMVRRGNEQYKQDGVILRPQNPKALTLDIFFEWALTDEEKEKRRRLSRLFPPTKIELKGNLQ